MRYKRTWEQINTPQRPLCFRGYPPASTCPSSFSWGSTGLWDQFQQPKEHATGRLYYKNGWTAVIFWNRDLYFVDEILTFDAIMELIRERFLHVSKLEIRRAYDDQES